MAVNIGKGFLNNPKDGDFQLVRQPGKGRRNFQIGLNAASLDKSAYKPVQGIAQTGLIQQWRMEQVGKCSRFLDHLGDKTNALRQSVRKRGRDLAFEGLLQRFQVHVESCKNLAGAIVQFAREPTPFVILYLQKLTGKMAKRLLGFLEIFRMLLDAVQQRLAFSHVASDLRKANDISCFVSKRRDDYVAPQSRTVFADAPALSLVVTLVASGL